MPAENQNFPWMSYYKHYNFFEKCMTEHSRVLEVINDDVGVYMLKRDHGDTLKLFICECYSYGLAEFLETSDRVDAINAVIINSNWCGYTDEAKLYCRERHIGLFDIREFMAALNLPEHWLYLTDEQRELYERKGLL